MVYNNRWFPHIYGSYWFMMVYKSPPNESKDSTNDGAGALGGRGSGRRGKGARGGRGGRGRKGQGGRGSGKGKGNLDFGVGMIFLSAWPSMISNGGFLSFLKYLEMGVAQ